MIQRVEAEVLALKALAFLAKRGECLAAFLEASGLLIEDLRSQAAEPHLLASVFDFVLADDARTLDFAAEQNLDPRRLHAARRALAGGGEIGA